MTDAEKFWLDSISLSELMRYYRGVNKRKRKRGCSSKYLGVHRVAANSSRPWRAKLTRELNGQQQLLWQQDFEIEEAAARAWDQAVLQHYGRCVCPGPSTVWCRVLSCCAMCSFGGANTVASSLPSAPSLAPLLNS